MSPQRDPEDPGRRQARVDAQHWDHPRQRLRNAMPIPERGRQRDCQVTVRAYLVWEADGVQVVDTVAYAWAEAPRCVLVQIDDRRLAVGGAWLGPWDVWPADGIGQPWWTVAGTLLDAPPWAG